MFAGPDGILGHRPLSVDDHRRPHGRRVTRSADRSPRAPARSVQMRRPVARGPVAPDLLRPVRHARDADARLGELQGVRQGRGCLAQAPGVGRADSATATVVDRDHRGLPGPAGRLGDAVGLWPTPGDTSPRSSSRAGLTVLTRPGTSASASRIRLLRAWSDWWAGAESNCHSRRRGFYRPLGSPPAQPTHVGDATATNLNRTPRGAYLARLRAVARDR
jgi:hypothetical protein